MTRRLHFNVPSRRRPNALLTAAKASICDCCWVARCRDQGCELRLPNEGSRLCLHGTAYQRRHKHKTMLSDCVVLWIDGRRCTIVVAELKSRLSAVTHAVNQLQGAADLISSRLPVTELRKCLFVPVILHQSIGAIELRTLSTRRINFLGRLFAVSQSRCGTELADLIAPLQE
jgi:hypothetical protein